jgi:hypothetical protein
VKLATLRTSPQVTTADGEILVARYGFDGAFAARHGQLPHLSVCVDRYRKRRNGTLEDVGGGALSLEDARRYFPGPIADLVPFQLCDAPTGEPMHYLSNTVFLAGDIDHWGLRAGERRQIREPDGTPRWELRVDDGTEHGADLPGSWNSSRSAADRPAETLTLRWFPLCRVGQGKARELALARRVAVWPEATDAELSVPAEELRAALTARLPALRERMRAACLAAGVGWPNEAGEVQA